MIIEIASSDILEKEVDPILILKDKVHAQHEWIISLEQNIFLILSILHLVLIYENIFIDSLHSI